MSIIENKDPLEPSLDDTTGEYAPGVRVYSAGEIDPDADDNLEEDADNGLRDDEVIALISDAARVARTYQQHAALSNWETGERYFRSKHPEGSKYTKDSYKNRSKYFKPKTRSAVRKNLVATAAALHASKGAIVTEAGNGADKLQRANAALMRELIDIRFNNKTIKSGVPWFMVSLAARQQTQVLGACASKQYWSYKTRRWIETEWQADVDQFGQPIVDEFGHPFEAEVEVERQEVLENKPVIDLVPLEHLLMSPASDWLNPVQSTPVLIVKHPMIWDDYLSMKESDKETQWRDVSENVLKGALYSDREVSGLQGAREGEGEARQQEFTRGPGRHGGTSSQVLDIRECFFHVDGEDYQCWTLVDSTLLSDPVPTRDSYPAYNGARPYVLGRETIEPFVLYSEAPVLSWKQSQDEINDFTNLHMDMTRKSVYPTVKVRSGRQIDYKAVQKSDAMSLLLVRDPDDVTYDRPPGPNGQSYQEVSLLSNDFDELAGSFSTGSVQSNRDLNDTVGGMKIMAANAGATSELDLRCYLETWAEPVISQIVMLEQYYEDDETLLAIAGDRSKVFQKFGVDQITDELLSSQITTSVNVGIGSSDPIQKLTKLKAAFEMGMPFVQLAMKDGKAELQTEEILDEIFSLGGYSDGGSRFVSVKSDEQKTVPAQQAKQMMEMLKKLKAENDKLKQGQQVDMMRDQMKYADADKKREAELAKAQMQLRAQQQAQANEFDHAARMDSLETQNNIFEFWKTQAPSPTVPPLWQR